MRGGHAGPLRVFLSRWAASGNDARATSWLEVFSVDVRQRPLDSGLQGALVTTVRLSCVCTLVLTDAAAHWANDDTDDDVILIGYSHAPGHRRD